MNTNKAALAEYIINEDELMEDAIDFSNENGDFNKLNNYYDNISSGKCNGCGKCCYESVQTNFIEFLNIINFLKNDPSLLEDILNQVEHYYMHDLFQNNTCPMLDNNNRCKIYSVRPLVCRLFGHYSQEDHEKNYLETLENNKVIKDYYIDNYDLDIPDERLLKKVEHCSDYENNMKVSTELMTQIKDDILMIDSKYFAEGFIDENAYNMGLVEWFIYLFFDESLAEKRINFSKLKLSENFK